MLARVILFGGAVGCADAPLDTDVSVAWAPLGSGSWSAPADSPCTTVHPVAVGSSAERDVWLQAFEVDSRADVPDPDLPDEALLLVVVECRNTGKELRITAVDADPPGLRAAVELEHPWLDGAIETTYWTAASVPVRYAGQPVAVDLTEVFEPEP